MPRFAANLSFLFTERPFPERFSAAAKAGFEAVEFLFPYAYPASDVRDWLEEAGLKLALFNTPVHDWEDGGRGVAALAGEEARFRAEFDLALSYADVLAPHHIHVMAGLAQGEDAAEVYERNLTWAAQHAPAQSLTIEPINADDMPGYFLADFDQAVQVIDRVSTANLGLQFDAYHAHRITGEVMGSWARCARHARHVQVAGVPGRHEPMGGQIDYPAFFRQLDAGGYTGFVGAEYHPAAGTTAGLGWRDF
ncbi:hydroxypyruvate isomerase [Actibacterium atlanticum]|uniref:Hydroxypyruvate isomerase n=1 Tax=Actibacterium atlanticum TaxID=1461693 RepID=A0A058ZKS7_9RHOB|nr:TIM barrel protein [Actibacterium atlanticum]KCV81416.1 hydroxypyruvate isomerase [Actibacterium atlanticum]